MSLAARCLVRRTLDIIHVAAALAVGAKEFVTFDSRQAAVATRAGLTVKPESA
jgi:hypothetical protein